MNFLHKSCKQKKAAILLLLQCCWVWWASLLIVVVVPRWCCCCCCCAWASSGVRQYKLKRSNPGELQTPKRLYRICSSQIHPVPSFSGTKYQLWITTLCIWWCPIMVLKNQHPPNHHCRMDEWMNEWMDGWMNGWMDGWMDSLCVCPDKKHFFFSFYSWPTS